MNVCKRLTKWRKVSLIAGSILLGLIPVSGNAHSRHGFNSILYAPNSKPFEKSFGEWSAEWWQFAFSIPHRTAPENSPPVITDNPLHDETGEKCVVGQRGPVWFLVGVFNESGTAVRNDCKVPAGKSLFFPVINRININTPTLKVCGTNGDEQCPDQTAKELRDQNAAVVDTTSDLLVEVDGKAIDNVKERFRVKSAVFDLTPPADNLFSPALVADTYSPVIDDGYYIFLKPLSVGSHTIHFSGRIPAPDDQTPEFKVDITYNLTVVPVSSEVRHRRSRRH